MGATAIGLQHSQLSEQIHEDLRLAQQSIVTMQNQLNSLVLNLTELQKLRPHYCSKRRNLPVVFLGEKCCLYANQSGIVRENAHQLLERIKARERNKETFWNTGWKSWPQWVAPQGGPLTVPTYCAIILRATG
jgi:hypothetical protein